MVHLLLSKIDYVEPDAVSTVTGLINEISELETGFKDWVLLKTQLIEFLSLPDARRAFLSREGRRVYSEKAFSNRLGHSFRMDRLVVDPRPLLSSIIRRV